MIFPLQRLRLNNLYACPLVAITGCLNVIKGKLHDNWHRSLAMPELLKLFMYVTGIAGSPSAWKRENVRDFNSCQGSVRGKTCQGKWLKTVDC